jgi:hypothetical protein
MRKRSKEVDSKIGGNSRSLPTRMTRGHALTAAVSLLGLTVGVAIAAPPSASNEPSMAGANLHKTPSNQLKAPSQHVRAPSNQMKGPSNQIKAPSNQLKAPNNQQKGSSNQLKSTRQIHRKKPAKSKSDTNAGWDPVKNEPT